MGPGAGAKLGGGARRSAGAGGGGGGPEGIRALRAPGLRSAMVRAAPRRRRCAAARVWGRVARRRPGAGRGARGGRGCAWGFTWRSSCQASTRSSPLRRASSARPGCKPPLPRRPARRRAAAVIRVSARMSPPSPLSSSSSPPSRAGRGSHRGARPSPHGTPGRGRHGRHPRHLLSQGPRDRSRHGAAPSPPCPKMDP